MKNCMLVKLKGASTNDSLPVFENVVEKEWIKTTSDGQYLLLDSVFGNKKLDALDIEIKFRGENLGEQEQACIFRNSGGQFQFFINGNNTLSYYIGAGNYKYSGSVECSADEEHVMRYDSRAKKLFLDGVDKGIDVSGYNPSGTTNAKPAYLFASGTSTNIQSTAGKLSIGLFRHYNPATGVQRDGDFLPFIINGVASLACLSIENAPLITNPAGGELIAYNDDEDLEE